MSFQVTDLQAAIKNSPLMESILYIDDAVIQGWNVDLDVSYQFNLTRISSDAAWKAYAEGNDFSGTTNVNFNDKTYTITNVMACANIPSLPKNC